MKANIDLDPITAHGWALGRELRKALVVAGFSQAQLAEKLGFSESRLSRIITGKLDATSEEVAAVLALCGVVGERRDFLVRMTRERSMAAWDKQEQLTVLRSLRRDASRIVEYSAVMLPELLWTDDYAEVVAAWTVNTSAGTVPGLVGTVSSDRAMLHRNRAPQYFAILSEAVLRLRVGSTQTMAAQLRHLVEESKQHNITIRVVPTGMGAHTGMRGSFCLVERPDLTLATVEDVLGVGFVDNPSGVSVYCGIADGLRSVALTPAASRNLISRIAAECGRADEDNPDDDRDRDLDELMAADSIGEAPAPSGVVPAGRGSARSTGGRQ